MNYKAIPILRIFDQQKAEEFYLGFLGMKLDWMHRFDADSPIYMQVSTDELIFHLSEHSGDCTPGSKVFVAVDDIDRLYAEITKRPYKYNRPSLEIAAWGDRCFTVIDPFSNKILFNQSVHAEDTVSK